MSPLGNWLLVSALLFSVGLAGALTRRSAILVLVGIELMLNAANLNFIAFWRYGPNPEQYTGIIFVIFSNPCESMKGPFLIERPITLVLFHRPAISSNDNKTT